MPKELYMVFIDLEMAYGHHHVMSATSLSHHTYPSFISAIFARSLPEMCAARHDMVDIACGRAALTVVALPVAPHMFRLQEETVHRAVNTFKYLVSILPYAGESYA